MSHKIVLLLLIIVVVSVLYFSWLPDPGFSNENYLPGWLIKWSNEYYNLRTAVPFLAVGFLLEVYTGSNPNDIKNLNLAQNLGIAALIVCLAEGGQFIIERRSPDFIDVFYGIAGSLIGAVSYNLLKKIKNA